MKNLKRTAFGLTFSVALLCLQGCKENTNKLYEVENYRCTSEQLDLVKKEFDICKGNYADYYCYLQAKKTHCDKVTETEGEQK